MDILYVPQISMYDKKTKELLPQADGNVNMMRNTILEWKKHRPDDMFYILLPKELDNNKAFSVLPKGTKNANPIFYDSYVVSARINRFNFPMNEISSLLSHLKIDLVINDVIELTSNFKQMFKIEFGYTPKFISNIRHLDDGINWTYMYRLIDGIMASDLVTILSQTMKNNIYGQLEDLTNFNLARILLDKITVFEPSISYTEISKYFYNARIFDKNKIKITFPGRLAKGEEKRTNYDKFIEAIINLRNRRKDFEVYFTDPNNAIDSGIASIDWIKTIPKDRRLFLNLLNQTDVIVSLMDIEGFGGISIREALLFNPIPIIPYAHEYKNMAPNEYSGYVDSPININDLENALNWAISKSKRNTKPYNISEYGMQFTVEEQFKKLLPKLEEIING